MLQPWVQGTIKNIINETPVTKRFFIEIPGVDRFDFEPGQFVTLDLPIHEQKNKRWRSYSIASWPDGTNTIELVIVLLEGGAGTTWLWENAVIGSELTLRGPQGKFTLPAVIEKDLYFICTGTGIAPFRSMLQHIKTLNIPHRNLYLIFGCRKFGDALYYKEMKTLEDALEGFSYLPTFSREAPDNHLLLRTGYVHAVYESVIRQNIITGEKGVLPPALFYLCGWKEMVDEAKAKIQILGYDHHDIHLELYG